MSDYTTTITSTDKPAPRSGHTSTHVASSGSSSSTGVALIVGGLVVAFGVLAFAIFGGDADTNATATSADIETSAEVEQAAEGAAAAVENAAEETGAAIEGAAEATGDAAAGAAAAVEDAAEDAANSVSGN
jgi:hypothetical protein